MRLNRPQCSIKQTVKDKIREEWDLQWRNYDKARMSKLFIKNSCKFKAKEALTMGRQRLGTLIRIVTGHNALNYFRNKVDEDINSECRFCMEEDETFWHLVTECPAFATLRREILLDADVRSEWSVSALMSVAEIVDIARALEGWEDVWDDYHEGNTQNEPLPEPD